MRNCHWNSYQRNSGDDHLSLKVCWTDFAVVGVGLWAVLRRFSMCVPYFYYQFLQVVVAAQKPLASCSHNSPKTHEIQISHVSLPNFFQFLHKSKLSSNSPFLFGLSLPYNKFDYFRHERRVESNTVVILHLPWAQLCLNLKFKVQNFMTHSTIYLHPSSKSSPRGSLSPFLSK